ncbi:MAG: hypothetical protein ABR95_08640 [Sphingobacteriales bacterium BACL12 MAG-120813-bin55]|jgi:outer membrane protein assembly factor BamA|nr:MAG: hypothetical protein ABR95_08640 [Sphingobacteriales bacterium BACL12 MAG-120813-bin55]
MLRYVSFLLLLTSWSLPLWGQVPDSAATRYSGALIGAPLVYYQPETRWAFGGGAVYTFTDNEQPDNNPGLLKALMVYTLERQVQSELGGDLFFQNNTYYLSFNFTYYRYPGIFYGIGNDNSLDAAERYTFDRPYFRVNLNRKVSGNVSLGFKSFYEYSRLLEFEPGGIFDQMDVPGEEGGHNVGFGPWLWFDSRDDIFYPTSGWKVDISSIFHGNWLGGAYNYQDHQVEFSKYIRTYKQQVLAFNFLGLFNPGNPPFNRMALLGGQYYMRGNFEGRLRDKHYITMQAEYRIPVWRFIGATAFGGVGQVAPDLPGFAIDRMKYSYGAGLRMRLLQKSNINIRLDYGFGSDGDSGLYLQFNEAF